MSVHEQGDPWVTLGDHAKAAVASMEGSLAFRRKAVMELVRAAMQANLGITQKELSTLLRLGRRTVAFQVNAIRQEWRAKK